jgi:hypothetical protein
MKEENQINRYIYMKLIKQEEKKRDAKYVSKKLNNSRQSL